MNRRSFLKRSALIAPACAAFGGLIHWLNQQRAKKDEGKWVEAERVPFIFRFNTKEPPLAEMYEIYGRVNDAPWHGAGIAAWIIAGTRVTRTILNRWDCEVRVEPIGADGRHYRSTDFAAMERLVKESASC